MLRSGLLNVVLLVLVLLSFGCSVFVGKPPTIVISSPPHGSQFREGDDVAVTSTATDSNGIVRVELSVDGSVVRTDSPANPKGQPSFTLLQTWKAVQGTHTITVRAFNSANQPSDPAVVSISVTPAEGGPSNPAATTIAQLPTIPATTPPTAVPPTIPPAGPSNTPTCTNNAGFVADVTVPDGTLLAPGQAFNKIWRVRNTGTCTWDTGYQFVFAGGEALSTTTLVAVPRTAPNATADLLVAMAAPSAPGGHVSQWRMRSASGTSFGATLFVSINVLGPTPIPTHTAVPSSSCTSGAPVIASFLASSTSITAGTSVTLSWGAVTGADSASIDQGIGGVATPGNITVSPATTTIYTLTATGCGGTVTRQVTITVNAALPPAAALVYDFYANAPTATWYSGAGGVSTDNLSWGDAINVNGTNDKGFMRYVNQGLEDGTTQQGLETHPKWVTNGFIVARYNIPNPIQSGTHFKTKYGFLNGASGQVEFIMGVISGGTPARKFDVIKNPTGALGSTDVDLSGYAGQTVQVYLEAIGLNTDAVQCWAVWVSPRLER